MRYPKNAASSEDQSFTLETTRASDQEVRNVISRYTDYNYERVFAKAKDRGRQVHLEKLSIAYVNSEPEIKIVPLDRRTNRYSVVDHIDVHPKEPWILIVRRRMSIFIWNYNTQEMAHLPFNENDSIAPLKAKFIATKKWIIVGCTSGYIKVYSYCKQSLFSEIESIKAHGHGEIYSLEQTGPYVLSSVVEAENTSIWDDPMDKIKLWDWENGWKLIRTFNMEEDTRVKLNPKDINTFVSTSGLKVWNICSPDFVSEIPGIRRAARSLDFFSRDGVVHMIVCMDDEMKASIWDYQNTKCVTTLKGHTSEVLVVFSHPELPVLITGSSDGTVRLWSSLTFSILGVLNCGLGRVTDIASLKESKRIAILHYSGLAIAEIDTLCDQLLLDEAETNRGKL